MQRSSWLASRSATRLLVLTIGNIKQARTVWLPLDDVVVENLIIQRLCHGFLQVRFPGGWEEAFRATAPNPTLCADDELGRVPNYF